MKATQFIKSALVCAAAAIAATTFTACDKGDDGATPDSLTGTKWKYTTQDGTWTDTGILSFTTSSTAELKVTGVDSSDGETDGWDDTFNYTYNKPNITLTNAEYDGEMTGIVDGNTMTLTDPDGDKTILTKQ